MSTELDFIPTFWERVGLWFDRVLGPSTTTVVEGSTRSRTLTLYSDLRPDGLQGVIQCQRVTYVTRYQWRWRPAKRRSVYMVSCSFPPDVMAEYGADRFGHACYPMLSNWLLKDTTFPHSCAIHTYLDAIVARDGGRREGSDTVHLS
jgi:hypothetical protein